MLHALRLRARCRLSIAGIEVEIDALFRPRATFRKMLERLRCWLVAGDGLPVGRACHRPVPGLAEIEHALSPRLASDRVIRQALDVLRQSLRVESFDRSDNPGVDGTPAVLEEA